MIDKVSPIIFFSLILMLAALPSIAQTDPLPYAIQLISPTSGTEVNGEFKINVLAFDRRGEGSGISAIEVYEGDSCSGESIVQTTGVIPAPVDFLEAMNFDEAYIHHVAIVRAAQTGAYTFTICAMSSYSGEIIGTVTETVNIPELDYSRNLLTIRQPEQGAILKPPFWVDGFTFDTSGGEELAPGIESIRIYAGRECEGSPIAVGKPASNNFDIKTNNLLSDNYSNTRYEVLITEEAVEGITGEFTFTLCTYSALTGERVHTRRRTIILEEPIETRYTGELVQSGFDRPIYVISPPEPDKTGKLFLVEQSGHVLMLDIENQSSHLVLDIHSLLHPDANERYGYPGLLNMTFDPDFAENGLFYLYYINQVNQGILARYQMSNEENTADPASGETLLSIDYGQGLHYGGRMHFGPDGYLYLSTGDGQTPGNSQNVTNPLGSILRLDVRTSPVSVPQDNPFTDETGVSPVYLYGLRNPWEFHFDEVENVLWIADTGAARWEEINRVSIGESGGNFGWPLLEGTEVPELPSEQLLADHMQIINEGEFDGGIAPIFAYEHVDNNCAIIGGGIYRGRELPKLIGNYIYADFCSGVIHRLFQDEASNWVSEVLLQTPNRISSFSTDQNSELYFIDNLSGELFKLVAE